MRNVFRVAFAALAFVGVMTVTGDARAAELPIGGNYVDDDGSVHEGAVEAITAAGISSGCHDVYPLFCADDPITRGQMAAFLSRAFDIPRSSEDRFSDDETSIFQSDINGVAAAGVTLGCNPPSNTHFCPDAAVTRGQMASFLARTLQLADRFPIPGSSFDDTDTSVFATDIARLADAGLTKGCNPPGNSSFCPDRLVTRAEMATFIARALGLEPIPVTPRPPVERVVSFTTYHKCCEARVTNIHVMADAIDGAVVYPGFAFSVNDHLGPRTRSKGYVPAPILLDGEGYCCDHPLNIGGGTSQFGTTIYNAIFRGGYEIVSHRPHSRYIDRYPLGIEATLGYPSPDVEFVNDTLTPVTIRTSYTSTSITVTFYGNAMDRDVSWTVTPSSGVTYNSGGYVRVTRTVEEASGDERTESWGWSYQGS
ncbi:MAG: VanW family protein [Acidimicrobiia bacterium]|nr:VanW family protein [Acidimicrobiia bacterium]MDH4306476.1 VanW family protein [Acidimicrobiia bacterium]